MSYQPGANAAVNEARIKAANAIVSNARVEAARIIQEANERAQQTIQAANQHAANIKTNARAYARKLNPPEAHQRPTQGLYEQLIRERYHPITRSRT